ncbi:FGGY-family carbohydrate kinase [Mesorhizobium sp. LHD-90]|uniref:FGGY-family carbohydrate kinase n=1 Tax=Mesorhizobium sp. LHD-90 TaxID=3071414 RepID=UPI0027E08D13|nr:FGGY-family carbohydrate kinase [Mesorhizobium sp. LHD-90]MDQ6436110.1 FGGY-family carbohydrate kinase [Mesorhizobium sp. LHD-90]
MTIRTVAVVDVGKSNAKVALVDLASLEETVIARTENSVKNSGCYPHFDTERLWAFMLDGLAEAGRRARPDAVVTTAHGASGALLAADGSLALPMLDYEHSGPETILADYDLVRPGFAETGSPRLPVGLNLGAQFFWQANTFPEEFQSVATILTHPQYWTFRFCGVAANEATSLGAHTDLWNPENRDFSSLVDRLGWRQKMAPVRRASDRLGTLLPEIVAKTGLAAGTPVFCGIHDSNASLYPHLLARQAPFTVVSTGTWVIVMAVGGERQVLDPARDTLINVNAFGDPVPSSRFMGGREFSLLIGDQGVEPGEAEIGRVLNAPFLLTPSVDQGSGPFQHRKARWLPQEPQNPGERFAAVSFYLAMMTATCLDLIGAQGDSVVEGPFGQNRCFIKMLATASGRSVVVSKGSTGTSIGAALLCAGPDFRPVGGAETMIVPEPEWFSYVARWRQAVG